MSWDQAQPDEPSPEGVVDVDPLGPLLAVERGFLAGLFVDLGEGLDLEARLAEVAEPLRGRLRPVAERLRAVPRSERAAWLARVLRGVAAPLPPGLRHVHGEWIEDALLGVAPSWWPFLLPVLPAVHRPLLARLSAERERDETASVSAAVETTERAAADAIQRAAFAALAPMEAGDGSEEAERLLALAAEPFAEEVLGIGAETLGHAFAGAELPVLARAAAPFGDPWTGRVHEAAQSRPHVAERAVARACLVGLPPLSATRATLLAIGATALGFRFRTDPRIVRQRLAQRLPRAAGDRLVRAASGAL
jgi:hypothetical protein